MKALLSEWGRRRHLAPNYLPSNSCILWDWLVRWIKKQKWDRRSEESSHFRRSLKATWHLPDYSKCGLQCQSEIRDTAIRKMRIFRLTLKTLCYIKCAAFRVSSKSERQHPSPSTDRQAPRQREERTEFWLSSKATPDIRRITVAWNAVLPSVTVWNQSHV